MLRPSHTALTHRLVACLAVLALAAGCSEPEEAGNGSGSESSPSTTTPSDDDAVDEPESSDDGTSPQARAQAADPARQLGHDPAFSVELQLGHGGADEPAPVPEASTTPLSAEETERLLARLPELPADENEGPGFALRKATIKPPTAQNVVANAFPPASDAGPAPDTQVGPLEVLRSMPDGDVALAEQFSLTFSQPMVGIGTVGQLAKNPPPVQFTPQANGEWRWMGTRTVVFEPPERLPMATDFTVTVPAGTESSVGGTLAEDYTFSFSTPPIVLQTMFPRSGPHREDATVVLGFDQAIDPDALVAHIEAASPDGAVELTAVPMEKLAADDPARAVAERLQPERRIVLQPAAGTWPLDAQITVTVAEGAPSAEGPRTTASAQSHTFEVRGPMVLEEAQCGWRDDDSRCYPDSAVGLVFSNPIDVAAFDPETIVAKPEIEDMTVRVNGNRIAILGRKKVDETYRVEVPAGLLDTFGGTMKEPASKRFGVLEAPRSNYRDIRQTWWEELVVLDPAVPPRVHVESSGIPSLDVEIRRVEPGDWDAYQALRRDFRGKVADTPPFPGKKVSRDAMAVDLGASEGRVRTTIDLVPALAGDPAGQFVVIVEPSEFEDPLYRREGFAQWVSVTRLGATVWADDSQINVLVTDLVDGTPVEGASVELGSDSVTTGSDGVATSGTPRTWPERLVVTKGKDLAFDSSFPRPASTTDRVRWSTFSDRGLYKPNETITVRGWVRTARGTEGGGIERVSLQAPEVRWTVTDAQRNELGKGKAPLEGLDGFDFTFTLPDNLSLGRANIALKLFDGSNEVASSTLDVEVQEFRRPEFELSVASSAGPHIVGESSSASVTARYFSGGPLAGASADWRVTASEASWKPTGFDEFDFVDSGFSPWRPWRRWDRFDHHGGPVALGEPTTTSWEFAGTTDGNGVHHLGLDVTGVRPNIPTRLTATATVKDLTLQTWTSSTALLVHPSEVYVGLEPEKAFVEKGQDIGLDVLVVDLDSAPASGVEVTVNAVRRAWERDVQGALQLVEYDPQSCTVTSAAQAQRCTFETPEGGEYLFVATASDGQGRGTRTRMTMQVAGGPAPPAEPMDELDNEAPRITFDQTRYAPGDTVGVLIQSTFAPATGVVTIARNGIVREERIELPEGTAAIQFPVTEADMPGLRLTANVVGSAPRVGDGGQLDDSLPRRPAFGQASASVYVNADGKRLTVAVTPAKAVAGPGGTNQVRVVVTDAEGNAVPDAEVALVAVDEAVLALKSHHIASPHARFWSWFDHGMSTYDTRSRIKLRDPREDLEPEEPEMEESMDDASGAAPSPTAARAAPGGRAREKRSGGGADAPIGVRTDFNPLAHYEAAAVTDANGEALVDMDLPDTLTRYRVTALAVAGADRGGKGSADFQVQLQLQVRPSAPRFLNYGDEAEVPVVVQSLSDEALTVSLAARARGMALSGDAGVQLELAPGARAEVRFPVIAERAGPAMIQFAAASGELADAATAELPIWSPATTEAFATYGVVDEGATVQPIDRPEGVVDSFGHLTVQTSSTALYELTDAALYLLHYEFACTEQLSSRILAVATLGEVLAAFGDPSVPDRAALDGMVTEMAGRLALRQNYDGGLGYWRADGRSNPFMSLHALHALARARAQGYDGVENVLSGILRYAEQIESHLPAEWSESTKRTARAYAIYARGVADDEGASDAARALLKEAGVDGLSLEALGWVYRTIAASSPGDADLEAVRTHIGNKVTETADAANFVTSVSDGAHVILHSNRRVDAVLLEAMILDQPESDLLPKLVRGLLKHRKKGRWNNTQENAFALVALHAYFEAFEKVEPNFTARVWLGDGFAGESKFAGRSADTHEIQIPMAILTDSAAPDTRDLVLAKDGPGRMYYRIGLDYAPSDLSLDPLDRGFVVERLYEAIDDPGDVSRDPDGTWRIKAGARVRVRVTMVLESRRYHVALVDKLPAGIEVINPDLRGGDSSGVGSGQQRWWHWYEHQNLRDERVEAFSASTWAGAHQLVYGARATTRGTYVAPPAKAEEMYSPETFGRSGTERVVVY